MNQETKWGIQDLHAENNIFYLSVLKTQTMIRFSVSDGDLSGSA